MWFLMLQISGLMLLAAALGAGLAYWWLIGRHEDVTESFATLKGSASDSRDDGALKDLQLELIGIGAKLDGLENTDLSSLQSELKDVRTTLPTLQADLKPIIDRLSAIESSLDKTREGMSPFTSQLTSMETRIKETQDVLAPLQSSVSNNDDALPTLVAQLRTIEDLVAQANESLAPVSDRLSNLELSLSETTADGPEVDLGPVLARLDALGEEGDAPRQMLYDVQQRLVGLTEQFSSAQHRIEGFEAQLAAINPTVDLSPIQARIEKLHGDLAPIDGHLSGLSETMQAVRDVDIRGVVNSVQAVEARLDVEGIENRLTSIEYGLAATHHMLRSRLAQAGQAADIPRREPFRSGPPHEPVFAPPGAGDRQVQGLDPLNVIRHPDRRADLLLEPGFGEADELEQIHGIGPALRKALNEIGVYYFWQMAGWNDADQAFIDQKLPRFRGQITRDSWVSQARTLSKEPQSAQRPRPFGDDR